MSRHLPSTLLVTILAVTLVTVRAAEPIPVKVAPKKQIETKGIEADPMLLQGEAANKQEALRRQFDEFKQSLLRLAQRFEASSKPEDREKAAILKKAIAQASEQGVDSKFTTLVSALKGAETFKNLEQLQVVMEKNDDLRKDIRNLIELLLKDDRDAELRRQREEYTRMLERLKEIIAKQERVRSNTDLGRKNSKDLGKDQDKVTKETKDLIARRDDKEGKSGEPKSDAKPEPKNGKGMGEAKDDTKDPKGDNRGKDGAENKDAKGDPKDGKGDPKDGKGDPKDGKGDPKDGKPSDGKGDPKDGKGDPKDGKGDPKDGKPGDGKDGKGDPKDGKGDPKDGKGGDPKDDKPGDGKDGKGDPKDGKPSDGKGDPKPGKGDPKDGKGGDPKSGKPSDGKGDPKAGKPGDPKEGKPSDGKGGKPSDAKGGDPKPGKPSDGKGGDPKPGKPSDGKGSDSKGKSEGKSDAKGGDGKPGKGGEGKPSDSKGSPGQPGQPSQAKGDPQQGGPKGSPPPSDQPPPETAQVKKQIQDANQDQKKAGEDLAKNKPEEAGPKQDDAIRKLNKAKKDLEDLLKQLREEEIERILSALQQRCERMLAMQIAVRDGTVALDQIVAANADKKATRADEQQSNVLSDKEDEIVREAGKALGIIEAEGSAVAFAEVFKQVRGDMVTVAGRLRKTDIGLVTVTIENDIIATLQEMVDALKKARQENQKPKPPMPGQPGQSQPQDQKLIEMIAELKMIRSMQKRVNDRTEVYGKQYEGEQVPPPNTAKDAKAREHYEMIQREVRDLGNRQEKIGRVAGDIYKGKNKAN